MVNSQPLAILCGSKLFEYKRNLWFTILKLLGFDDPTKQDIPEVFNTDEWYKGK
jgi:hypothetical protein